MLLVSDHSFVTLEKETMSQDLGRQKTAAILRRFLVLKSLGWQECHAQHSHLGIKLEVLETPLLFRRWSGCISGQTQHDKILTSCKSKQSTEIRELFAYSCVPQQSHLFLGIDKIFQNISTTSNKAIQFLLFHQIIGPLGSIYQETRCFFGLDGIVFDEIN